MTPTSTYDCIIVGAGIAGCALAFQLSKDGKKVFLIERDLQEPDRIVGELLQPGGVLALRQLGLQECLEDIDAVVNYGYGLCNKGEWLKLTYPENPYFPKYTFGKSFHHGKLIQNLRQAVKKQKNITLVEGTACDLLTGSDQKVIGIQYYIKQEGGERKNFEQEAPLTFICDGCFSKFRKEIQHHDVIVRSHFIGTVLKDCPLPYPHFGHVLLADPSPILLYQIGTHDTRILVDIPGKLPSSSTGALKTYMEEKVKPQLPLE